MHLPTYNNVLTYSYMHICIYICMYTHICIYIYIHILPHNLCAVDIGLFKRIFCTRKRICIQTYVYIKYTPCLTTCVLVWGYLDIGLFWPFIKVSLDEFSAYTNVYALFWRCFFCTFCLMTIEHAKNNNTNNNTKNLDYWADSHRKLTSQKTSDC